MQTDVGEGDSSEAHSQTEVCIGVVPEAGLEPTLPKEQDFKSCVSTDSTTQACHVICNLLLLRRSVIRKLQVTNYSTACLFLRSAKLKPDYISQFSG